MDSNGQLSFLSKSAALQRNPLTGVSWVSKTPTYHLTSMLGQLTRFGNSIVSVENYSNTQYSVNVHKYDPATQAVTTQAGYLLTKPASTPSHTEYAQIKLPDDRILIVGGNNSAGTAYNNTTFITYNTSNDTATAVAGTSQPSPKTGKHTVGCAFPSGAVFYTTGQGSGDSNNDFAYGRSCAIGIISGNTITWSVNNPTIPPGFGGYNDPSGSSARRLECMALSDGRILLIGAQEYGEAQYYGTAYGEQPYVHFGEITGTGSNTNVTWTAATVDVSEWPGYEINTIRFFCPMGNDEFCFTGNGRGNYNTDNLLWKGSVVGNTVKFTNLGRPSFFNATNKDWRNKCVQLVDGKLYQTATGTAYLGTINDYLLATPLTASLLTESAITAHLQAFAELSAFLISWSDITATIPETVTPINAVLYSESSLSADLPGALAAALVAAQEITALLGNYQAPAAVLAARLYSTSYTSANLDTAIRLIAAFASRVELTAELITKIQMGCNLSTESSLTPPMLQTEVRLAAAFEANQNVIADLLCSIRLATGLESQSVLKAILNAIREADTTQTVFVSTSEQKLYVKQKSTHP